VGIRDGKW